MTTSASTTTLAPIALFAYKRPGHLRRTLEALRRDPLFDRSPVRIYCDGARSDADVEAVRETRQVAQTLATPLTTVVLRDENLGLRRSIVAGVDELTAAFGTVIVIEDDLTVGPQFLSYMNAALVHYQDQERIFQVSGHMFPVTLADGSGPVFLPFTTTWGWATWRRAWRHFDPQASGYQSLTNDRALRRRFDLNGSYPYFRMLRRQLEGQLDSWGILWYLSVFRCGGITVYPRQSLVANEGFDGSGTHCSAASGDVNTTVRWNSFREDAFPSTVDVDPEVLKIICRHLAAGSSLQSRIARRLGSYLKSSELR